MKVINFFTGIFLASVASNGMALVDAVGTAHENAQKALTHSTMAEKNIIKANVLLQKGSVAEAKQATQKAADLATQNKFHAQEAEKTLNVVQQKVDKIASTSSQAKKATQQTKVALQDAKDKADEVKNRLDESLETLKKAKESHSQGNKEEVQKHTQKAIGLLEEVGVKIKHIWDKLFHAHESSKKADDIVKTQMIDIAPTVQHGKVYRRGTKAVLRPQDLYINGSD